VHGRFGLQAAVKLLKGAKDPRLERAGLDSVRTYGALSHESEEWITRLLRRLVTAGWVLFEGDDRPIVVLTEEGRGVMEGRIPARLLLPDRVLAQPRAKRRARGAARTPDVRAATAPRVFGLEPRVERAPEAEQLLDDASLDLFEALRTHRLALSREHGVPPYVVASDRSLRDISRLRPRSRNDLLLAHGMGPVKVERYGKGLLAVVAGHPSTDSA
jgi:ATP-dependent DNA helicase RecQ